MLNVKIANLVAKPINILNATIIGRNIMISLAVTPMLSIWLKK